MSGPLCRVCHILLIAAVGVFRISGGPSSQAQESPPAAATEPVVANTADQSNTADQTDKAAKEGGTALREQTIYVPYSKLRGVFEKEGRGVFLPYEKFQELWQAAQRAQAEAPEPRPPVAALITEITSKATAQDDVLLVEASLRIDVVEAGWHQIPLRLGDAAIRRATIGDKPARIVRAADGGYAVLIEHREDGPSGVIELELEYAKAIQKSPGTNSVSIQAPQAPVNRWEVHIPEAGVKVEIHPLIAATQPADAAEAARENETVVLAFVGTADQVAIHWNPKAEGASGLDALVAVQAEQEVSIDEGVVRTRTRMQYQISRSQLDQLRITVPADHKVAAVFDPNVRQWEVSPEGDTQQILVHLFEPATSAQSLTVELERFLPEEDHTSIAVPLVAAQDVSRQQGFVVLKLAPALRWTAEERSGLLQLDATELPASLSGQPWDAIFRYAALPFALTLNIEKVEPRIRVEEFVHAYLEPDMLTVDLVVLYQIERTGVFQLPLEIAKEYEVRQISGYVADGVQPAAVDTYHVDADNGTRWLVNLASKAQGRVGLIVQLTRRLNDPNLLTPTGSASNLPLNIPRAGAEQVEQVAGKLVIFAPESLRVTPITQQGAQNISFREATQGVQSFRRGDRFAAMAEVLALAYARDPVALTISAERRKPQVVARQLLIAQIESGIVHYEARFLYDIRYSPIKSLRIDIPADISSLVRNETTALRDQVVQPAPADVVDGSVAWQFQGESDLLGEVAVVLRWQQNVEPLGIGDSIDVVVPYLRPIGTDRAWGQIVVVKSESIDIRPQGELRGLRPIDPQHDLMPGAAVPAAARAYEFQQDWALTLTATRYQLVEVKRTSLETALLRMVVTRSDQIDVHALYRVRSARQRLAVQFPERVDPQQSFDAQPLRINGQPVTLEKGTGQQYYIPLAGHSADEPLLLELRYTVSGDTRILDFPTFPGEPAVGHVYLSVYIPEERALLGTRGPWNLEHFNPWRFSLTNSSADHHADTPSDESIFRDMAANISVHGEPLHSFTVQGSRYLFSTLRPDAPPQGALRLRTADSRGIDGVLFLIAAVVGLAFLLRPISEKLAAIGLALIAIILAGVFWPTASMYLLDGKFVLAAAAILLLWATAEIVKLIALWRQHLRTLSFAAAEGSTSSHGVLGSDDEPPIVAAEAPPNSSAGGTGTHKPQNGGEHHV